MTQVAKMRHFWHFLALPIPWLTPEQSLGSRQRVSPCRLNSTTWLAGRETVSSETPVIGDKYVLIFFCTSPPFILASCALTLWSSPSPPAPKQKRKRSFKQHKFKVSVQAFGSKLSTRRKVYLISANPYKSGVFVGPFFRQKSVSRRRLHVFETILRISGPFWRILVCYVKDERQKSPW